MWTPNNGRIRTLRRMYSSLGRGARKARVSRAVIKKGRMAGGEP